MLIAYIYMCWLFDFSNIFYFEMVVIILVVDTLIMPLLVNYISSLSKNKNQMKNRTVILLSFVCVYKCALDLFFLLCFLFS